LVTVALEVTALVQVSEVPVLVMTAAKDAEGHVFEPLTVNGIIVPAKVDSVNAFVKPVKPSTEVTALGKPAPLNETEVPAGPDEGVNVTVGATIVNVPATTEVLGSEITTVCAPG